MTDRGDPDNCGALVSCAAAKTSYTTTVSITVNAVNDAPVVLVIYGPSSVPESTTTARTYTFTISDVDSTMFAFVAGTPPVGRGL